MQHALFSVFAMCIHSWPLVEVGHGTGWIFVQVQLCSVLKVVACFQECSETLKNS